jgi:hypothetical protein
VVEVCCALHGWEKSIPSRKKMLGRHHEPTLGMDIAVFTRSMRSRIES